MKPKHLLLLSFILFFSCIEENKTRPNAYAPKVVEARGYIVPKDSMAEPRVILINEDSLIKIPAGQFRIVPTNTNIHPAGIPKVVLAGMPRVCTPGQDTF